METQSSILVPVNFSEESVVAIKQSYNLARVSAASCIVLLHVITEKKTEEADVQNRLNQLAEKVKEESGRTIITRIARGKAADKILEVAEELKPKIIVIGFNNSESGFNKSMGDIALKVVSHSNCPVITIKGNDHRLGCKTIVLPLDLTKETRQKTGKAIEFAKFFGSTIRIVAIHDKKDKDEKNKLTQYGVQIKNYIQENRVKTTLDFIESDNIARSIMDFANGAEADLIMVTTEEEHGLKGFFLGTTTEQLINISNIPVLSIRPKPVSTKMSFVNPY